MANFTSDQLIAIESTNKNILVTAAAGSGKTAVLVERIIRIVTNTENPVDIDRLLIVTFTSAAAEEMLDRILVAIEKKLLDNPADEHLQRQLTLLGKSNIITIHGFCNKVIRNYFHVLSLDPTYTVGDEIEMSLLKKEVLVDVLEEKYSEDNEDYLKLVESLSGKYTDENFQDLVIRMHSYINAEPYPFNWLSEQVKKYDLTNEDFEECMWIVELKYLLKLELMHMIEMLELGILICKEEYGPIKYIESLENDLSRIDYCINEMDKEDGFSKFVFAFKNIEFERLSRITKNDNVDENLKEQVSSIRDTHKKSVKKLIDNIKKFSAEDIIEKISKLKPLNLQFADTLMRFNNEYVDEKKQRSILDYSDLEHYALNILYKEDENGNFIVSNEAKELQEHFVEILTDEYQDSNSIQELILNSVSNSRNRFMVGDVKQSIYKFRMARPEIFLSKYSSYSDTTNDNVLVHLSMNFRSRYGVLHAINYIFYQLMQSTTMEIDYTKEISLVKGSQYPDEENENIKVLLVSTEVTEEDEIELTNKLSPSEEEAHAVAKEIKKMMENSKTWENNNYRKPKYSDFAILMWSTTNDGEIFSNIFNEYGIPTSPTESKNHFNTYEVQTMLSFLKIIDNPQQDIPLATVLHSPIYSFTASELLTLKTICTETSLNYYETCRKYFDDGTDKILVNKIGNFLEELDELRNLSLVTPISKLIWHIYQKTDFINLVGIMENGTNRQNNLRILADKAYSYEKTSFKGLLHFIQYVEKIRNSPLKTVESTSETDYVQIMTIHKSKGLEFPYVFMCRMAKKLNKNYVRDNFLMHQEIGLGSYFIDLDLSVKYETLPHYLIKKKMDLEQSAESLRLLYVSMTRAKEKLILVGTINKIESQLKNWCKYNMLENIKLPIFHLVKSVSFLDYVMPPILRHLSGASFLASQGIDVSASSFPYDEKCSFDIEIVNNSFNEVINEDNTKAIVKPENTINISSLDNEFLYDYNEFLNINTKISISEMKRLFYEVDLTDSALYSDENVAQNEKKTPDIPRVFKKPKFIMKKTTLSPTEKGTAIHTVLEHIDVKKHNSIEEIENLIENLINMEILPIYMKKAVDTTKILDFVNSDIGLRMKNAETIHKEKSFTLGLDPDFIYNLKSPTEDKILIHGIIDCYFIEDNEIVLLDYKSDKMPKNGVDELIKRHKLQLSIYKKALEGEYNLKVKEAVLYLYSTGKSVRVL